MVATPPGTGPRHRRDQPPHSGPGYVGRHGRRGVVVGPPRSNGPSPLVLSPVDVEAPPASGAVSPGGRPGIGRQVEECGEVLVTTTHRRRSEGHPTPRPTQYPIDRPDTGFPLRLRPGGPLPRPSHRRRDHTTSTGTLVWNPSLLWKGGMDVGTLGLSREDRFLPYDSCRVPWVDTSQSGRRTTLGSPVLGSLVQERHGPSHPPSSPP